MLYLTDDIIEKIGLKLSSKSLTFDTHTCSLQCRSWSL